MTATLPDPVIPLEALCPQALRGLAPAQLPTLARQIRHFLVAKVCATGGHLGPNLGTVELSIALHRVFDSPRDMIVFDTGHQAYTHKILTGRADEFDALRQANGLAGYPCRMESPHDVIENSHASTALSYADGLAKALPLRGERDKRVVAVVGDGALTGGMCWEALNNIGGAPDRPVVVLLNDNGRSYSPTVGGLATHLAELRSQSRPGDRNLFTDLGLTYVGPVDGHDIAALESTLRFAAGLNRPVIVHAVTVKGRGHSPAELDVEDCLHTVGVTDPAIGRPAEPAGQTWTHVFAKEITHIAAEREDVVGVTAAMLHPTGLSRMAERFPGRVFDVGIAEQHAVCSAAGLAMGGLHPVVAIYSTFLNRAFDQVLMDVALHRLPVVFVLDRAGVTGPDGPSHHGMWDASVLPVVPGLRLACPRDSATLRLLLREAFAYDGPAVVRYPKASVGADIPAQRHVGGYDILRTEAHAQVLLLSVGPLAAPCLAAAAELAEVHGVPTTVVDPRWINPLDPELVKLAEAHSLVLAVEDTATTGSLGSRLAQALAVAGSITQAASFALPDRFLPHASRSEILHAAGLDATGITTTVLKRLLHVRRTTREQAS
ncbi:1-deoxy-D-xylulose-5-phosphate synthase [Amycolatopsis sp. NPDC049868]|uniref:1-deoxy-D-xylulose-5-phosphate synthase n=1 Tax=Amycolatopsis sp. NPDC049868 TaxID=3363934 RepID=UPI00379800C4